jgi:asparagine synthase (glutamine-hydrolysing)
MCSISGILSSTSAGAGMTEQAIARMNDAQRHRGPDDSGTWKRSFDNAEISLGNTRLAIIDTSSAGHQPMLDPSSGNCITYNGETYNFKELSATFLADLSADIRVNPRSKTDTEVILRCYTERGVSCFKQLRGMFALAIWDERKRELVLARDRFGIKPLYYHVTDNRLIFASALRALLATGMVQRKLSRAGLDSYLATGSVTAPLTIVEDVRQLLPGHYLRVNVTQSGNLQYTLAKFATDEHRSAPPKTRAEAVVQLRAELEESVGAHLVSDVPLGVFLSGGMDSSALVALMSRVSKQRPKTFSVVFDETDLSEEQYSRSVAGRFNTEHCEIRLGEEQLFGMLPDAIAALDQPSMDGINTYVVAKAVKEAGVTVALSGLGGDELFAGYPSFRRALKFASLPFGSRRVLRAAAAVGAPVSRGSVRKEKFWQLASSSGSAAEVYRITRQLFSIGAFPQINAEKNGSKTDVVNAISRLEMEGYMANTLLRDTDAMSMAHSLEVRVPFVDTKVVAYVLSLPGEWKLGQRDAHAPKALLADTLADLLPRDFLARKKMGFTLPFEQWVQGRLRADISSVFHDAQQLANAGLVAENVRDLWRRFLRSPRAVGWSRPWSLFVLANWCRLNRVTI